MTEKLFSQSEVDAMLADREERIRQRDGEWVDAIEDTLHFGIIPETLAGAIECMKAWLEEKEERIRLQSLRYAAEIEWWHRQWHRATGIPCDATMEVCKRHQACREVGMPALGELEERIRVLEEQLAELPAQLLEPLPCGHPKNLESGRVSRTCAVCEEQNDLQARIERVKGLAKKFRESSNFYSGLETEDENVARQETYERCADELLAALDGETKPAISGPQPEDFTDLTADESKRAALDGETKERE